MNFNESKEHFSFKQKTAELLIEHLEKKIDFQFLWNCKYCGEIHHGNLIKNLNKLELEYSFKECKPDIALFNEKGEIYAVIEIVLTHAPVEKSLEFYKNNNIILIQYNINKAENFNNMKTKIASPDIVELCHNPKCPNCNHFLQFKILNIIDGSCWKCKEFTQVAVISNSNSGNIRGEDNYITPQSFTKEEIEIANKHSVYFKKKYSKTANETYIGNVCEFCDSLQGDFYLFTDFFQPAECGMGKSEKIKIGCFCEKCDKKHY